MGFAAGRFGTSPSREWQVEMHDAIANETRDTAPKESYRCPIARYTPVLLRAYNRADVSRVEVQDKCVEG